MEMEIEEEVLPLKGEESAQVVGDILKIWFFNSTSGSGGIKQNQVEGIDLDRMTLGQLKDQIVKDPLSFAKSPSEIDIIYNSKVLKEDDMTLDMHGIKGNRIVTVIKKIVKQKKVTTNPSDIKLSEQYINQVTIALRTAFLNHNFNNIVERLAEPEMLENIFAVAPGLSDDPVGIAVIQDLHMIFHLADHESLQKLAQTRPWVLEALNFVAAAIHAHTEPGSSSEHQQGGIFPHIFPMYDPNAEDEDMDDDDDDDEGAAGGQANHTRRMPNNASPRTPTLTSAQLTAALGSVTNFFSPNPSPRTSQTSTSVNQQRNIQIPPLGPSGSAIPSNQNPFQGLLQTAPSPMRANSITTPQATTSNNVTPELVSRIMREALQRLPPDQRDNQFNQFLQMAQRVQDPNSRPSSQPAPSNPPSQSQPPPSTSAEAVEFREQLAQMREMGIFDERLSIMALRVSDGDANTAADLVLSGWKGEGFGPD